MADCERVFREHDVRVHLAAWPAGKMPRIYVPKNALGKRVDHAVWVCLHGEEERRKNLHAWGIDPDENLKLLESAGFSSTR